MSNKNETVCPYCEQGKDSNNFVKTLDAFRERGYDYVNIVHSNGYIVMMWIRPVDFLTAYTTGTFSDPGDIKVCPSEFKPVYCRRDDYSDGFGSIRNYIANPDLPSDCSYIKDGFTSLSLKDRLYYALDNNRIAYRHFGTSLSVYGNIVIANSVIKNSDTVSFANKDCVINYINDYAFNTNLVLSIIPGKYQSRFLIDDPEWISILRDYENRT